MTSTLTAKKPRKQKQETANPVNPGNNDTINAKEKEEEKEKVYVQKVVGIGRIELVGPSTDLGIAMLLSRSGLSERIKYREDVGWLAWDEQLGRWTSDGVAFAGWLMRWIKKVRGACWCEG